MILAGTSGSRLWAVLFTGLPLIVSVQPAAAVDIILTGNYLKVGVDASGGLIDASSTVGIDFRATGSGAFPGYDFLRPGDPFEFYSVGYTGIGSHAAGFSTGNYFGATTTATSALSASTTFTSGSLSVSQILSFAANSSIINFSVTLTNTSGSTALTNLVYARGLDPDQDVFHPSGGAYETTNTIVNGNLVTAFAPVTGWTIGIFSDSVIPHTPSVRADWSTDAYALLTSENSGYGDNAINMAWNIGTLAAGQSVTIPFEYRITAIPEPTTYGGMAGIAALTFALYRRRKTSGGQPTH